MEKFHRHNNRYRYFKSQAINYYHHKKLQSTCNPFLFSIKSFITLKITGIKNLIFFAVEILTVGWKLLKMRKKES